MNCTIIKKCVSNLISNVLIFFIENLLFLSIQVFHQGTGFRTTFQIWAAEMLYVLLPWKITWFCCFYGSNSTDNFTDFWRETRDFRYLPTQVCSIRGYEAQRVVIPFYSNNEGCTILFNHGGIQPKQWCTFAGRNRLPLVNMKQDSEFPLCTLKGQKVVCMWLCVRVEQLCSSRANGVVCQRNESSNRIYWTQKSFYNRKGQHHWLSANTGPETWYTCE